MKVILLASFFLPMIVALFLGFFIDYASKPKRPKLRLIIGGKENVTTE